MVNSNRNNPSSISELGLSVALNSPREEMATTIDIALVYEIVLASPGMSETVKIDLRVSRKTVLLLSRAIERGMLSLQMDHQGSVPAEFAGKESLSELEGIVSDCLQKAGLSALHEKLKNLNNQ